MRVQHRSVVLIRSRAIADHQTKDTDTLGREVFPKLSSWVIDAAVFKVQSPGVRVVLLALGVLLGQTHNTDQHLQLQAASTWKILKPHIPRKIFKSLEKPSTWQLFPQKSCSRNKKIAFRERVFIISLMEQPAPLAAVFVAVFLSRGSGRFDFAV